MDYCIITKNEFQFPVAVQGVIMKTKVKIEFEVKNILIEGYECTCDVIDYPLHSCPYQSELYGNDEKNCRCCPYCENLCILDI